MIHEKKLKTFSTFKLMYSTVGQAVSHEHCAKVLRHTNRKQLVWRSCKLTTAWRNVKLVIGANLIVAFPFFFVKNFA